MQKPALFLLAVLGTLAWHFFLGAGSCGRTPYGTAASFAQTLAANTESCAARMEEVFPEARGARHLCGGAMAEGFRRTHKTYLLEKTETEASAVCLYGST